MPKRIIREWDVERTALLDLDELYVIKDEGDRNYFFAWLQDQEVGRCPICGCDVLKVQDLFSKTYFDIIDDHGKYQIITLVFQFYKYRCLNSDGRHIFAKNIKFASQNDNVTYRLEDEIARRVISGLSYYEISLQFSEKISKQAIGQIFNRWVRNKEERRKVIDPPSALVVVSGRTDRDQYTLFLNIDNGINVFDVIYGVGSLEISGKLQQYGLNHIETIISDCNPTIVDTINDYLPNATYIIPVQYWFKLVTDDFAEYAHEILRWSTVRNKDHIIMQPESELGLRVTNRDLLLETRPAVQQPYYDYNELRDLISDRERPWTVNDLDTWTSHVDPDFRSHLEATIFRLNAYKDLIYQHEQHRDMVLDRLYALTNQLEELISEARTFSDAQLKARLLYSVPTELDDWRGIPIEDVIAVMEEMNLQRRKKHNEYE